MSVGTPATSPTQHTFEEYYAEQEARFAKAYGEGQHFPLDQAWWDQLYLTGYDIDLGEAAQFFATAMAQFATVLPTRSSTLQYSPVSYSGHGCIRIDIAGFCPPGCQKDQIIRERATLLKCLEDNGLLLAVYYEVRGWQGTHEITASPTTP